MLKGKVAIVTGGTRGIGFAIVQKYLENGASVVLFGSKKETALFNATKSAASFMKEQNSGCILNTSSMVSLSGQPSGVGYPTSKFAVNGMTTSLARELGKYNIRVNAVAPGVTRTDMVAALPEQVVASLAARIPLRTELVFELDTTE